MTLVINGQEDQYQISDSLINKKFSELENNFYYYLGKDDSLAKAYAKFYLEKGVNKKNNTKIATGYLFLSAVAKNKEDERKYLNSCINYSKNTPSYLVPSTAYSILAGTYIDEKNFKKALDLYILAHDSSIQGENLELTYLTKYNIGVLKNNIGMNEDALIYAKEFWNFTKDKNLSTTYLNSLFLLSSAYSNNNKSDSATYFNKLGAKKAIELDNQEHLKRFVFLEGVNQFGKGNYQTCIDSLAKSLKQLEVDNNFDNIAVLYYYMGKSYHKLDNFKKSIYYLKKMDSIFLKTNNLVPYCRDGYRTLINYYKKTNNPIKQLHYTSQLLTLDSILDNNYKYLSSTIYKKHETPILISEKVNLIESLNKKNKSFWNYFFILLFLTLILSIGLGINYYKRKKDYRKFNQIISKINNDNSNKQDKNDKGDKEVLLGIDEAVIESIIIRLENFEKTKGFTQNKITLQFLAKKLGTNSKYLSKVINIYKKKSFSNYINDLRVDYIINRLNTDHQFRKFTLEAIALEAGFNNKRSFYGVFQKKTGISPSYFVSELNKQALN